MPIITLTEQKTFLGISLSDVSMDAKLQMFIDSVCAQIENFCDCSFEEKTVLNELHDSTQSDVIVPKHAPIISIESLYFGCNVDGTGGSLMDPDRNYYIDANCITLRDNYSPRGRGYVRIDYTHGYETVPADVKMCAFQAVKAELKRDKDNTEGIASRSKMNESESLNAAWDSKTGLPKQIVSKLQAYRVYEVPNISMAARNR